jgi:hypothetical protein
MESEAPMTFSQSKMPGKIKMPNGEMFVPVLVRIYGRDEYDRPEDLFLIYGNTIVEITNHDSFMIAYVNEKATQS